MGDDTNPRDPRIAGSLLRCGKVMEITPTSKQTQKQIKRRVLVDNGFVRDRRKKKKRPKSTNSLWKDRG